MKVHLHGWFGFKNLGDGLLLQQAVNAIGAVDGVNRIEIGVDKHDYLDDFLNINVDIVYSSRGMGYLFQSAFSNDALVIGPGGLFPHRNPIKVFVYLLLTGWWKVLGKKVLYFGLGATSLQDSFSINCWRHIASHSDAFLARDSDLLNACGIRETDTLYSAADAVFLGSDGDCIQTNQRIVAVAFANLYNRGEDGFDSFEADCAKLVKHLAEQTDKVELLSFTAGADEDLNKQIAGSLGFSNVVALSYEGTLDAVSHLRKYSLVLGMRFHSVLLSARDGIPVVAISYAHKTERLLSSLGFSVDCIKFCKDMDGYYEKAIPLDTESLMRACDGALANPSPYIADRESVQEMRDSALKMVATLRNVLSL